MEEKIIEIFKDSWKHLDKNKLIELQKLLKDESIADDFLRVTLIYDVIDQLIRNKDNGKIQF